MPNTEAATPGEIVTGIVRLVPRGKATSYGAVGRAAVVLSRPIGGARTVAWILASLKPGSSTPWHRVVGAGGIIKLPDRRGALQRARLRAEGARFLNGRLDPECFLDEGRLLTVLVGRARARNRKRVP